MTTNGAKRTGWSYAGDRTDGAVPEGLGDLPDEVLLDWRDLDALMREQARLTALWRAGKLTHRAYKAGMYGLHRMIASRELAMGSRLVDLEALVERLEAQVAMVQAVPSAGRPRLLS